MHQNDDVFRQRDRSSGKRDSIHVSSQLATATAAAAAAAAVALPAPLAAPPVSSAAAAATTASGLLLRAGRGVGAQVPVCVGQVKPSSRA
jgi:hypothetical protein